MSENLGPLPEAEAPGSKLPPAPGRGRPFWRSRSFGWRSLRGAVTRDSWPDVLLGALLTSAYLLVHDVPYVLTAPYWNDEAWVAISTKLPLHQLPQVASSTPVGWDLLIRLISWSQDPPLRIVPLLFGAFTVTAAFAYVRTLGWPRVALARLAAVLAGVAALMMPSALVRNDLKQYTADAFITLVVLLMVARLENRWSRRRVIGLAVVVVVGFLFSAVSAFVGAAAFGSVLLVQMVRRRWANAIEILVAGVASGVVLAVTFLVLYRPGLPAGLNDYWAGFYVPVAKGWTASWKFVGGRSVQEAIYLGMGPVLLAVALVVAGVVTLMRLGRFSVALVVPALLIEMIVLGALQQYPLFDLRTSHFLTTAFGVTAAIGVAGLCCLLARIHLSIAFVGAAVAIVLFVTGSGVRGDLRSRSIPNEDLRTPAGYLAAHRQPGDVVVVSMSSNWGFAYYWRQGTPGTRPVTSNLQKFVVVFPDQPNILVATGRDRSSVDEVMARASAAVARIGPAARIWFVHQHTIESELGEYRARASALGLKDQTVVGGSLELWTRSG